MIKKNIIFSLLVTLQCFSITSVHANTSLADCNESKMSNINFSQCLDRVKSSVDRELQTWVNNQTFILEEVALVTGRTSALAMFKRSQSNFITFRENNCRWQYLAMSPSTAAGPAYKKCYIFLTKNRIVELDKINTELSIK
jgi:uncharacterized protein YecT (DUF1311 family)